MSKSESKYYIRSKIREVLKLLSPKEKRIVDLFYGFNSGKKYTQKEIAHKLGASEIYVNVVIEDIENKLSKYLSEFKSNYDFYANEDDDFYHIEAVDEETKKLIAQMSDAFFSMFQGIDPVLVEDSLNFLPRKDKEIVFLYYGLDGIHCLDYDDIANKFGITVDEVDEILEKSISKTKRVLKKGKNDVSKGTSHRKRYLQLTSKHGQKNIDLAMSYLDEKTQNIIKEYCAINNSLTLRELGEKYGLSIGSIYNILNNGLKKIESTLQVINGGLTKEDFYRIFDDFEENKVDEILSLFDEKEKNLIESHYGFNKERKTLSELAKMYETSEDNIASEIRNVIKHIGKKLRKLNKINLAKFYLKFEGYTKEQVDEAIAKLDEKKKDIIVAYYGLRGEKESLKSICEKNDINEKTIYNHVAKAVQEISKLLENPSVVVNKKSVGRPPKKFSKNNFYNKFEGYTQEEIDSAISKLDEKEKAFILSCVDDLLITELAEKFNINPKTVSIYKSIITKKVKQLLENPDAVVDKKAETKAKTFYDKFEGYTKEQVDSAISKLGEKEKSFILSCIDGLSIAELVEKYNFNSETISVYKSKITKKVRQLLENPDAIVDKKTETKAKDFYDKFEGYTKEQVDAAISKLSEKDQDIVALTYGLKGENLSKEEICVKYAVRSNYYYAYLSNIVKKVKKVLENPTAVANKKREVKQVEKSKIKTFYDKFEGYTQEQVDEAISKLDEKEKAFILSCVDGLSIAELVEKYNFNPGTVSVYKSKIAKKIKQLLENPNAVVNKKRKVEKVVQNKMNTFYDKFKGYSIEEINEKISKLDDRKKGVLCAYYGLGVEKESLKTISKKYEISEKYIYLYISNIVKEISNLLKNPDSVIKLSKKEKFYQKFEGYTVEQVDEAISKLSDKESDIITLSYELEGSFLSKEELAKKYDASQGYMWTCLNRAIEKIKILLDNPDFSLRTKRKRTAKVKMIVEETKKEEVIYKNEDLLYAYLTNGDKEAYEKLIENNLNLVSYIIQKMYVGSSEKRQEFHDEVYSYGVEGLIRAIQLFDVKRINEVKFSTYASKWIDGRIKKYLSKGNKSVNAISLDDPLFDGDDRTIENKVADEYDFTEDIAENDYETYKSKKIHYCLENLEEKERKILEMYFGFNGQNRIGQQEIANIMGISQAHVSRLITVITRKLAVELNEFKGEYSLGSKTGVDQVETKDEKKELIEKMNKVFFSLFDEKKETEIREKLNELLGKKSRKIVSLYYGLDGKNCLDYDEIADKFKISVDVVSNIIDDSIKKLRSENNSNKNVIKQKNIIEYFYQKFEGYSREQIDEVVSKLSNKEREILSLTYGLDGEILPSKEIGERYGFKGDYIYVYNSNLVRKIQKILSGSQSVARTRDSKNELEKFYSHFIGYTKEQVKVAVSTLYSKYSKFTRKLLGTEGKELTKAEIAQFFGISSSAVSNAINKSIEEIIAFMGNSKGFIKGKDEFYNMFTGYSEDQIDKAFLTLNEDGKRLVSDYYGLDCLRLREEDIAEARGIPAGNLYYLVNEQISLIKEALIINASAEQELEIRRSKLKLLVEKYGKDAVKVAVEDLSNFEKSFIAMYYKLGDTKYYSLSEIYEKIGSEEYLFIIEDKILEKISLIIENSPKMVKIKEMQDKFIRKMVDKENYKEAFKTLSSGEVKLIVAYYGLNGKDIMTLDELSSKLNVSNNAVMKHIEKIIEKLNSYFRTNKNSKK